MWIRPGRSFRRGRRSISTSRLGFPPTRARLHFGIFRFMALTGRPRLSRIFSAMKYRRLGKTNLRVSVIGIGTWQLGGEWGKDFTQPEVDAMFDECRRVGINLIDTAECYGDHTSERLIGAAIQRDRDHWVVATKF